MSRALAAAAALMLAAYGWHTYTRAHQELTP